MAALGSGLLMALVVVALDWAGAAYLHQYLHALGFAYLPIGALFFGMLCGVAYGGVVLSKGRFGVAHYAGAVAVALLAYVGMHYALYRTAYVNAELRINFLLHGRHISNYSYDRREPVTWRAFFIHEVQRRTPGSTGPVAAAAIVPNPPVKATPLTSAQTVFVAIEAVSFPLSAALTCFWMLRHAAFCRHCGRAMTEKTLFGVPIASASAVSNDLNRAIASGSLPSTVAEMSTRSAKTTGLHAGIVVEHCTHCGEGFLELALMDWIPLIGAWPRPADTQRVPLPTGLAAQLVKHPAPKST